MEGVWDKHETQARDEQTKDHELAARFAKAEVEGAGFEIVEVRDPFVVRPSDEDGPSRWWLLIARKR